MFKLMKFLFLFLFIFLNVNCDKFEKRVYFDTIKSNQNAFNFYNPDFDKYLNLINLIINEPFNITSQCINDLKILKNSLIQKEEWALKVYESNGKPRAGFLSGLNHNLGNLDLCVFSELNKFDNQFCLISLRTKKFFENVQKQRTYKEIEKSIQPLIKDIIDFNFGTIIGTCSPLSCDINNVASIINRKVLKDYELEAIPQKHCTYKNDKTFKTTTYYISWAIILIFSSFSISTLFLNSNNNFLKPFSIKDNLNYIYNKESTSAEKFLAGFKVVYMVISVPAHFFGLSHMAGLYSFSSDHVKEINLHFNWIIVECLEKLTYGIDFMIYYGGFMTFLMLFDQVKNGKINFIKAAIFLPIANWPVLIGFISISFANLFNGPFLGDAVLAFETVFFEKGWKSFAFLSNTDYLPEQIIVHNWFNSVLFHLFIIFYFVLYVFTKNEKFGLIISGLMLCLNIFHSGYIMINQNIPPFTHLITGDSIYFAEFAKDYMYWYNHLDVYLVGFVTGYLYKNNKVSYLRNSFVYYSLLIITFNLFIGTATIPVILNYYGLSDNIYCQLFYFTLKRFFFSLWPSFVFLSFKAGYMVKFKNALSWRGFIPLSRLASSIIACQFFYFFYWHFTRRDLIKFTSEILFKECFIILIFTFITANIFYVIIEAPIINIIKQFFLNDLKKNKKLDEQKDLNDNKTNEKDLNFNALNEHLKVN